MRFSTKMKLVAVMMMVTHLVGVMGGSISAIATESEQSASSKPLDQKGLQVTVTMHRATFAEDEPLKFNVQFKNMSEKPFRLHDADYFWNWRFGFEDQRKIGPWRLSKLFKDQRPKPETKTLKPGESLDVPVTLDPKSHRFEFAWDGRQREPVEPVKNLPPGKYELVIETTIQTAPNQISGEFPFWTGSITTNPVAFTITSK